MNHFLTLFDFERGPDTVASLTVLGLFLLIFFGLGIWIHFTKEDKPHGCWDCEYFRENGCDNLGYFVKDDETLCSNWRKRE